MYMAKKTAAMAAGDITTEKKKSISLRTRSEFEGIRTSCVCVTVDCSVERVRPLPRFIASLACGVISDHK